MFSRYFRHFFLQFRAGRSEDREAREVFALRKEEARGVAHENAAENGDRHIGSPMEIRVEFDHARDCDAADCPADRSETAGACHYYNGLSPWLRERPLKA